METYASSSTSYLFLLWDEVSSAIANMNGEFVGMDDKVNDKIKEDEKRIKDGINDDFKEIINDESGDKKFEALIKDVENFKAKNDKLEKEITTVRQGVYNWRSEVKNMNGQFLDEVNKDIDTKVEAMLTKESVGKNQGRQLMLVERYF